MVNLCLSALVVTENDHFESIKQFTLLSTCDEGKASRNCHSPKQGILVSRYKPKYFYLHQKSMKNMPCHDEKVFSIVKLHDTN